MLFGDLQSTCLAIYNQHVWFCLAGLIMVWGITDCDSNPCTNGGECEINEVGYQCACPPNSTGPSCDGKQT